MSDKLIEDHPFIASKREDSCDFAWYPDDTPWTVCDYPQAQHACVAKDGWRPTWLRATRNSD